MSQKHTVDSLKVLSAQDALRVEGAGGVGSGGTGGFIVDGNGGVANREGPSANMPWTI